MINPNALPTSPTVQDFQNLESALDSPDYNNTLQAMRYMQAQRQPTTGINMLPQVTVPMQEGGMMEEAMMEQQMPIEPMNPEEQAMMMQQVEQQEPREPNPEIQAMAQQVASFGRGGDKLLLHIRPDEMQGLSSMLTVTINPTTGMPEVFLNKIARAGKRIVKGAAKGVKKITTSKAFKTIAPIALAIAAPYALGALAPTVFGAGATAFGGALAAGTVGGAAVTAGLGSLAGNLLAGRKFGDAAKAALITGATAGLTKGIGNKMAGKTFFSGQPVDKITGQPISSSVQASKDAAIEASMKPVSRSGYENLNLGEGVGGTPGAEAAGYENLLGGASPQPSAVDMAIQQGNTMPTLEQTLSAQSPIPQGGGFSQVGPSITNPGANTPDFGGKLMAGPVNTEQTFASRLGDAKDAVIGGFKDRYGGLASFDKGAIMNLGKDVLTADIGQSALELEQQQQQALEDQQLADAGYSVSYPSGFGTQRVIRDSSGVVVNATAQDILARALGGGRMQFAPQTTFAQVGSDFQGASPQQLAQTVGGALGFAKEGGLISLKHGGEFSGMVPGDGHGMEDNVYMPITEGPKQVGTLAVSPSEYVVDSYTMAALGNGNADAGAKVMDRVVKHVRKKAYGDTEQPNEISGLQALKPMMERV